MKRIVRIHIPDQTLEVEYEVPYGEGLKEQAPDMLPDVYKAEDRIKTNFLLTTARHEVITAELLP